MLKATRYTPVQYSVVKKQTALGPAFDKSCVYAEVGYDAGARQAGLRLGELGFVCVSVCGCVDLRIWGIG